MEKAGNGSKMEGCGDKMAGMGKKENVISLFQIKYFLSSCRFILKLRLYNKKKCLRK